MGTEKISLSPRAYRLVRAFAKKQKTKISEVMTLMVLDCDCLGNWVELGELIDRKNQLGIELRKRRDLARKRGTKLSPGQEPRKGEARIEYLFDQAVETEERELEAELASVPAPPPKVNDTATIIPPKNNSFLRLALADLRDMHQNATEAGDTFGWGPALEAIIYAKECLLTMQETSKASGIAPG